MLFWLTIVLRIKRSVSYKAYAEKFPGRIHSAFLPKNLESAKTRNWALDSGFIDGENMWYS